MRIVQTKMVLAIRLYQKYVSPLFQPRCRYYPTCSNYALQAVQKKGYFRAVPLIMVRILKCNPLFPGGVDLVPDSSAPQSNLSRIKEHNNLTRGVAH
ncbi:MAG: membrane protein insertion efficiency factor YidD [Candidatus Ancillula sp.]|nr:membrane protein insertion efficiency factor YidD [Candidatus Ancillula sp.]